MVNNCYSFKITEVGDRGNLGDFLRENRCTTEIAIRYLLHIAEAARFLHDKMFIHRNLRAASVFIYSSGNVSYFFRSVVVGCVTELSVRENFPIGVLKQTYCE